MKQATAYHTIRVAMMGGLLLLGAVTWFLHRAPDWQPPSPGVAGRLAMFGRILWAVAGVGLVYLYSRHRDAGQPARVSNFAIVAWSVGEALALFGVVFFYLTGVATWYVSGMLAMSITFVAFPPPRAAH